VRKTIEIQTARLAAAKADKADIAAMELAIRDMYNPSSTDSEYTDSDMRFHQMIGSASKNKIFEAVVKSLSPFIHESIHATLPKSARPEPHLHLHGNILAAIKAGDADEAERQIRKHLEMTERLIFEIEV
jgi:GntR family transcriptional repressor for pyruvate dehydrogenase complex